MRTEISGTILVLALSATILGSSFAFSSLKRSQTVASYGQVIYPNYTVWTEDGVYYAKDAYGTIAYSSPVASNVLNYASAALTTGGSIFVKNGVYQTTTWNIANPNITVNGESWNSVITAMSSNMNSPVILITGNNCSINNIAVNGNLPYQSSGFEEGISIYGSYVTLDRVHVYDTYDNGILIANGASYCKVDNCLITGSKASGIVIYGNIVDGQYSQKCTISNSTVLNSGLDGIFLSGCDYCIADNILVDGAGDSAFEIQGGGVARHSATGNIATNIYINDSFNPGIYIDGSSTYPVFNTVISNFEIYNCTSNSNGVGLDLSGYVQDTRIGNGTIQNTAMQGIYVYNNCARNIIHDVTINATGSSGVGIDTLCTNNTLDDVTTTNAGAYGMQIDAGCTNNLIRNSRVVSSTNAGIITWADNTTVENTLVDGTKDIGIYLITCNYCTISGNRIYDPSGDGIYINAGTGNVISNNYIFNIQSGKNGIMGTGAYCVNDSIIGNYINCTTASGRTGIAFWAGSNGTTGNRIGQNTIYNTATGINLMAAGVNGTILANNQLISCSTPITDSGVSTAIYNNTGYNPVGIITNPFRGNNHILLDLGGDNATWSSAVTYTNWESPKTLYISSGTVTAVVQNGQTIFSTTDCTVVLQPGDTFSITFSSAPTIRVEGQ